MQLKNGSKMFRRGLVGLLNSALFLGCLAPAAGVSRAAEKKAIERADNSIAYFVDCGDYVTDTVCKGDQLGTHNSATDQVYGEDQVSGYKWGIVDTVSDPLKNGTAACGGVFTDNTWPYESNSAQKDAASKTMSNRYTKNQFENGVAVRGLDYKFELEAGTYELETYCTNPWSCSNSPSLLIGSEDADADFKAGKGKKIEVDTEVKETIKMEKAGDLTVSYRGDTDDNKAINVCYIKLVDVSKIKEPDEDTAKEDFNADAGEVRFNSNLVASDLTLPVKGTNGSTITWTSSKPDVITEDGKVTRPEAGEADVKVTLEATITMGSFEKKKQFTVTVLAENSIKDTQEFLLDEVEITDPYYLAAQESDIRFLKAFDNDRILSRFRETAGMDTLGKKPYNGWENSYIGGHSIGHYLSACAQAVKATGDTELKDKLDDIIAGLKECQDNLGTGFIFAAQIQDKNDVEKQFNIVEGKDKGNTWVPWYTMHKIIAGLIDTYRFTGNEQALEVASGLGDWVYNRVSNWTSSVQTRILSTEYGGMNDCLYDLYSYTGDPNHLEAAHMFDDPKLYAAITSGKKDTLKGKHANATIPKFMGAVKRYEVLTKKGEASEEDEDYLHYAEKFWNLVVDKHAFITGGVSDMEHFRGDNLLDVTRTQCNCESCCAFNLLKIARELYKITGEKKYADYYENTLRNAIMGAIETSNGSTTYFTPMATGYFKVFGDPDPDKNMFWCCTGSGMENFTKLGDSIYFKAKDSLVVNQYVASTVKWQEGNMKISQESDVTKSDVAKFKIQMLNGADSQKASIYLRVPDWIAGAPTVKVNGSEIKSVVSNGYVKIDRSWKEGDEFSIQYPMEVTAYGLPDNSTVYGFKYGPTVLAAKLGKEKMNNTVWAGANLTAAEYKVVGSEEARLSISYNATARQILGTETLSIQEDVTPEEYAKDANEYFEKDASSDTLSFHLKGTDADETFDGGLTFVPYNTLNDARYGIYWYFDSEYQGFDADKFLAEKEEGRFGKSIVDSIQPGYGQYENDNLHQMKQSDSEAGTIAGGGSTRLAKAGGYFMYNLIVDKEKKNSVLCQFAKEDNGKTIKVSVGDTVIAEETLNYDGSEDIYQVYYEISDDVMAKSAKQISVKNDSGETETHTIAEVKFESGSASADSARLVSGLYMTTAYSNQAAITSLTCSDGEVKEVENGFEVSVPSKAESTKLKFNIADQYGLLYVNDTLVNDAKAQEFALNEDTTNLAVKVYAEDHKTTKDYTVVIRKQAGPTEAPAETAAPTTPPAVPTTPAAGPTGTAPVPTASATPGSTAKPEKDKDEKKQTKKKSIKITGKKQVKKGKTITLQAKLTGVSGKVKWSVKPKKKARITPKGKGNKKAKLKALKKGKVKVTAKVGKVKKTVTIKIK